MTFGFLLYYWDPHSGKEHLRCFKIGLMAVWPDLVTFRLKLKTLSEFIRLIAFLLTFWFILAIFMLLTTFYRCKWLKIEIWSHWRIAYLLDSLVRTKCDRGCDNFMKKLIKYYILIRKGQCWRPVWPITMIKNAQLHEKFQSKVKILYIP